MTLMEIKSIILESCKDNVDLATVEITNDSKILQQYGYTEETLKLSVLDHLGPVVTNYKDYCIYMHNVVGDHKLCFTIYDADTNAANNVYRGTVANFLFDLMIKNDPHMINIQSIDKEFYFVNSYDALVILEGNNYLKDLLEKYCIIEENELGTCYIITITYRPDNMVSMPYRRFFPKNMELFDLLVEIIKQSWNKNSNTRIFIYDDGETCKTVFGENEYIDIFLAIGCIASKYPEFIHRKVKAYYYIEGDSFKYIYLDSKDIEKE